MWLDALAYTMALVILGLLVRGLVRSLARFGTGGGSIVAA